MGCHHCHCDTSARSHCHPPQPERKHPPSFCLPLPVARTPNPCHALTTPPPPRSAPHLAPAHHGGSRGGRPSRPSAQAPGQLVRWSSVRLSQPPWQASSWPGPGGVGVLRGWLVRGAMEARTRRPWEAGEGPLPSPTPVQPSSSCWLPPGRGLSSQSVEGDMEGVPAHASRAQGPGPHCSGPHRPASWPH